MWFSTVLFLLIVICCVAGVVNALAVQRELCTQEQEYHAQIRAETGERIRRENKHEQCRQKRTQ